MHAEERMTIRESIAELTAALMEGVACPLSIERIDAMQQLAQHVLMHLARARGMLQAGQALDDPEWGEDAEEEEDGEEAGMV